MRDLNFALNVLVILGVFACIAVWSVIFYDDDDGPDGPKGNWGGFL